MGRNNCEHEREALLRRVLEQEETIAELIRDNERLAMHCRALGGGLMGGYDKEIKQLQEERDALQQLISQHYSAQLKAHEEMKREARGAVNLLDLVMREQSFPPEARNWLRNLLDVTRRYAEKPAEQEKSETITVLGVDENKFNGNNLLRLIDSTGLAREEGRFEVALDTALVLLNAFVPLRLRVWNIFRELKETGTVNMLAIQSIEISWYKELLGEKQLKHKTLKDALEWAHKLKVAGLTPAELERQQDLEGTYERGQRALRKYKAYYEKLYEFAYNVALDNDEPGASK